MGYAETQMGNRNSPFGYKPGQNALTPAQQGTANPITDDQRAQLDAGFALGFNPTQRYNPVTSFASPSAVANLAIQDQSNPDQYAADVSRLTNYATGGNNSLADITKYQMGGDPNWAMNHANAEFLQAGAASQRAAPTLNMAGINAATNGMTGAAGQQMQAGNALMAMGQMPAGPSVAELAMRQQADQAQRQQASMASSARGGNSALALQNAAANSANISGQLNQNLGIQRAQEDMANRQFAANAIGSAANVFGGAGNTLQGVGGLQYNAANANAGNQLNQTQLNDALGNARTGQGYSLVGSQLASNQAYDQSRTGNNLHLYGIDRGNEDTTGRGTVTGSRGGDQLLGAGLTAAGAVAGSFIAPGAGTAAGAALGSQVVPGVKNVSSDIRAKKNIASATEQVSDAYRMYGGGSPRDRLARYERMPRGGGYAPPATPPRAPSFAVPFGAQGRWLGNGEAREFPAQAPAPADVVEDPNQSDSGGYTYNSAFHGYAPAYSYEYKNPNAPGAESGTQYGPMAQDLEQTPAGASVVETDKNGRKAINAPRLTLMNASEISNLRRQMDAVMARQDRAFGTPTAYPQMYAMGQ